MDAVCDYSPDQLRAARALLGWSRADLARAAKVRVSAIRNFEEHSAWIGLPTLQRLQETLNGVGIDFIPPRKTSPWRGVRIRVYPLSPDGPSATIFGALPMRRG